MSSPCIIYSPITLWAQENAGSETLIFKIWQPLSESHEQCESHEQELRGHSVTVVFSNKKSRRVKLRWLSTRELTVPHVAEPLSQFKSLDKSHEPYEYHKSCSFQYSHFVSRGLVVSKPGWDSRGTGYKPLGNLIYFWNMKYNSEPEAQVQDIPPRGRVLTGCVTKPGEARTVQGHRQQHKFPNIQ